VVLATGIILPRGGWRRRELRRALAGVTCSLSVLVPLLWPVPPSLPADRALALACSIRTLRHLWLHIRCCGSATVPLRTIGRSGTLADYLMALRCRQCGAPPRFAMLIDQPAQATQRAYGRPESWQLIVVGEDEPDPAFVARLAVVKG